MHSINRVGVVGLGNMGRGIALSLARAGLDVLGFDAAGAAMDAAAAEGIATVKGLADLSDRDVVVLSLPTT